MIYTKNDYDKAYYQCSLKKCKIVGKQLLNRILKEYQSKETKIYVKKYLKLLNSLKEKDNPSKINNILEQVKIIINNYIFC